MYRSMPSRASGGLEPVTEAEAAPPGPAGAEVEELFRAEHLRLLRALYLLTGGDLAEAEDLLQEAFVKLLQRWDRILGMANPTGYLYRTAMNGFRSRWRRRAVERRRRPMPIAPADPIEAAEDRDTILRALREVPPRQRLALVLTEFLDLRPEEVADVLESRTSQPGAWPRRPVRASVDIWSPPVRDLRTLLERAAAEVEPTLEAWDKIRAREGQRRRTRKIGSVSLALVVATGGIAAAVVALHPAARPAGRVPSLTPRPVTVTLQARGFPATCTATLPSSEVRPGDSVSIAFSVRDDSGRQVFAQRADPYGGQFGRLLVEDSNGRLLFDTETRHYGQSGPGPIRAAPLGSEQSIRVSSESVVARWSGPLQLQGFCPSLVQSPSGSDPIRWPSLPPFDLSVVPAGPAPAPQEGMDRAVAATGGLFDTCRPGPDGQPMDGVLNPPVVGHPPTVDPLPLDATCWAQVRRGAGFLDITLFFEAPTGP